MDQTFLQERITATKAQIVAYEDAIAAITSGGVQEYLLDTGQTRQRVTKLNLSSMEKSLDSLYNRYATLDVRLNGGGSVMVNPSW